MKYQIKRSLGTIQPKLKYSVKIWKSDIEPEKDNFLYNSYNCFESFDEADAFAKQFIAIYTESEIYDLCI